MNNDWVHRQAAHCESGVTAALVSAGGRELSEPMAFGVGSGIFFGHIPFVKIMDLPITTYRTFPGTIAQKCFKRLGVKLERQTFRSEGAGTAGLDALLARGRPVGAQVSVQWLSYLPRQFRFPFNAHHVIVTERRGDDYVISDPIADMLVTCSVQDFTRSRFARGPLAPKGLVYYPTSVPPTSDLAAAAIKGMRDSCHRMLYAPMPFLGVRGIRNLAKRMRAWPVRLKDAQLVKLNIGQIVRMQEEIGTGGAGFRYLYAAFLQEAAAVTGLSHLAKASAELTRVGDTWREFAAVAARYCRAGEIEALESAAGLLEQCAAGELAVFRNILKELPR